MNNITKYLPFGILLIPLFVFIGQAGAEAMPANSEDRCTGKDLCHAKVKRVVDGDTIVIASGERVRYIGIDTPESAKQKSVECFGKEASQKNKELVEGKEVKLVKDVSDTDKFGRLLRYAYQGDIFVNEYLVANGFANSVSYRPDIRYQAELRTAEETARREKKGLWADNACQESRQVEHEVETDIIARLQEDFVLIMMWFTAIMAGSLWLYVKKR